MLNGKSRNESAYARTIDGAVCSISGVGDMNMRIGELDKKYGAAVATTAANILHDRLDVEECVNDTYLGVWNSIPPQQPSPLVSYVCRIARNLAVSRLRSNAAVKRNSNFDLVLEELEDFIPSDADVETDYAYKELLEVIDRFLLSYRKSNAMNPATTAPSS